jgi:hypothetical protein
MRKVAPIANCQARGRDYRFKLVAFAEIAVNYIESLFEVRVAFAPGFGPLSELPGIEFGNLNKIVAVLPGELVGWAPTQRSVEVLDDCRRVSGKLACGAVLRVHTPRLVSSGTVVQWWCIVVQWCSGGAVVVWWSSGGVVERWCSGAMMRRCSGAMVPKVQWSNDAKMQWSDGGEGAVEQ